jgi:tetratricopeptide (TPR) repeat protein
MSQVPSAPISAADAVAAHRAGMALMGEGRIEAAEDRYRAALAADPGYGPALHHLGLIRLYHDDAEAAMKLLADAVGQMPAAIEPRCDLAHLLSRTGELAGAIEQYRAVLGQVPTHLGALGGLGQTLQAAGRLDEALACYEQMATLDPASARLLAQQGNLLRLLDRPGAAVAVYRRALAADPRHAPAHNGLGLALGALGESVAAAAAFRQALVLQPDVAAAHYNLGTALQVLNRLDEAADCYERAVALQPDYADAHWNLALTRLAAGDYARAWPHFEWRWRVPSLALNPRTFAEPLWLGAEAPAGRTLLLHADQGLGDTLQFCRYVPVIARLGARVVLEVQPPLVPLLTGIEGAAAVIARGDPLPAFDGHCPLSSLPLAAATTIDRIPPPVLGTLPTVETRPHWRAALGAAGRPRIGLVWAGSPGNSLDHRRSMPARHLRQILDLPDLAFFSLQRPLQAPDAALLEAIPPERRLGDAFADFVDTAIVLRDLDLVLTVDTAIAHLAGTLGCPAWILLAHGADWRWLVDRSDSPWYPSLRLFRQPAPGDWAGLMRDVRAALIARAW